ncbi:hypothetical protein I312_106376 [Cryptococcus bacillisporus CA1280]|uniref:uncharacterized protein n=1 Tax=Cryptococcus bacillisporus CA1280 TaxID=1296109 RepID=UPI003367B2FA
MALAAFGIERKGAEILQNYYNFNKNRPSNHSKHIGLPLSHLLRHPLPLDLNLQPPSRPPLWARIKRKINGVKWGQALICEWFVIWSSLRGSSVRRTVYHDRHLPVWHGGRIREGDATSCGLSLFRRLVF